MSEELMLTSEQYTDLLKLLSETKKQRSVVTYRQVIEHLQLPTPSVRRLAFALEELASADYAQGWPLRSALVVSQTGSGHPQLGFMQCVQRLGRFKDITDEASIVSWFSAELAQIYEFSYPEV